MTSTPSAAAPGPQPSTSDKTSGKDGRRCSEHGIPAVFDVDCFRCPYDNAIIGPAIR